jgi:chromosome segregation ATPase
MLVKKTSALLIAVICAFAGCSSTRELSSEERGAKVAIARAEDSGADKYSGATLQEAKEDLERAKVSENAALRDKKAANDQLLAAQQRNDRAKRRIVVREAQLAQAEEDRKSQLVALDETKARADDMRARGIPEEDVMKVFDERANMQKVRIHDLESQIASLQKEIAAMQNVKRDSDTEIQTARSRLRTAEDRLESARASYRQVEDRANLARAEALDARRGELSDQIGRMTP